MDLETIERTFTLAGWALAGLFGARAGIRRWRTGSFEGRLEELEKRVTEELNIVRDKHETLEDKQNVDRRYVQRLESRTDEALTVIHEELQRAQVALHRATLAAAGRWGEPPTAG